MAKTFIYTKTNNQYYLKESDEYEYDGIEFEYKISDDEVLDAILDFIVDEYFPDFCEKLIDKIKTFIKDCDLLDDLFEIYKDQLKDYFEDDAFEYFKENEQ